MGQPSPALPVSMSEDETITKASCPVVGSRMTITDGSEEKWSRKL